MKTLDRQKLFGTVHNDEQGRCFMQDGVYFDSSGNEWQAPEPAADVVDEAEPVKAKKK